MREIAISGDKSKLITYFSGLKTDETGEIKEWFNIKLGTYNYTSKQWEKNDAGFFSNMYSFYKNWNYQKRGDVLLHYAIQNGHMELVKYLYGYHKLWAMPINERVKPHFIWQSITLLTRRIPLIKKTDIRDGSFVPSCSVKIRGISSGLVVSTPG